MLIYVPELCPCAVVYNKSKNIRHFLSRYFTQCDSASCYIINSHISNGNSRKLLVCKDTIYEFEINVSDRIYIYVT